MILRRFLLLGLTASSQAQTEPDKRRVKKNLIIETDLFSDVE